MSDEEQNFPVDDLVPVSVWRIVQSDVAGEKSVVILREDHGEGLLPIAVGSCEAAALEQLLDEKHSGKLAARPLTHELMGNASEALGGRLERGVLTRLVHETFFAQVVMRRGEEDLRLDARPSDVISLTLVAGSPLYVLRELLDAVCGDP